MHIDENIPIPMFPFSLDRKKNERVISITTSNFYLFSLQRVTFRTHQENPNVLLCINFLGYGGLAYRARRL